MTYLIVFYKDYGLLKTKFNISYNLNQITKIYKQLKLTYKKPKYRIIKNIDFLDELIKKGMSTMLIYIILTSEQPTIALRWFGRNLLQK